MDETANDLIQKLIKIKTNSNLDRFTTGGTTLNSPYNIGKWTPGGPFTPAPGTQQLPDYSQMIRQTHPLKEHHDVEYKEPPVIENGVLVSSGTLRVNMEDILCVFVTKDDYLFLVLIGKFMGIQTDGGIVIQYNDKSRAVVDTGSVSVINAQGIVTTEIMDQFNSKDEPSSKLAATWIHEKLDMHRYASNL